MQDRHKKQIVSNDEESENVSEYIYLGSLIASENYCTKDIKRRIDKAMGVLAGFNAIWKSKTIRYQTILKTVKTCIHETETWMIKKTDTKKLLTFEMYHYRKILNVCWMMRITNVEVRRRLKVTENIMQSIMGRKLGLFGHICSK